LPPFAAVCDIVLRYELKRAVVAAADPDRPKISSVDREDAAHTSPLGDRGHHPVHEADSERRKLGVDLESSNEISWLYRLELVSRSRIEDVGQKPAHRRSLFAQEIVDLGENERRNHDRRCRSQFLCVRRPGIPSVGTRG
jgi:hypothetical protein